ncbi:MAG: hypothetical protein GXC72_00750 [Chitinophagaceae bacterium]|nr:hypothetical protein [Chitinophagaceae bacterium]
MGSLKTNVATANIYGLSLAQVDGLNAARRQLMGDCQLTGDVNGPLAVYSKKLANRLMALRDQPYLPLYIQDFMTDEKLAECSAESTGVYIRLMCIMHKSEQYGTILLKQKHKQSKDVVSNFAAMIAKQMPYDFHTVKKSLAELIGENVLSVEGDMLIQKRMVKDNAVSEKRSKAGKTGGEKTQEKNKNFAKAKTEANDQANTEYENDIENDLKRKEGEGRKPDCYPGPDQIPELLLTDTQIGSICQLFKITKQQKVDNDEVNALFEVFKIQNLTGKKFYADQNDIFSHFLNWCKTQNVTKNEKGNPKNGSRPTTGAEQLAEKIRATVQ